MYFYNLLRCHFLILVVTKYTKIMLDNYINSLFHPSSIMTTILIAFAQIVLGPVQPYSAESWPKTPIVYFIMTIGRDNHDTVEARCTSVQQYKRSILQLRHDSHQNSFHQPMLSPAQYSLNGAESWPKTPLIYSFSLAQVVPGLV